MTVLAMASAHDFVATKIFVPLYESYLLARPSTRAAQRFFREGLAARRAAAGWSVEQRRDWMLARLRTVVRSAADNTAYYRQLFQEAGFDPKSEFDFDDFAALPILERNAVRAHQEELVNRSIPRSTLRRDSTGGSGGVPTEIWLGPEERGWRQSGIRHFAEAVGVNAGARMLFLWGHHLDPVAADGIKQRTRDWLNNVTWRECLRLSPAVLERYHEECELLQPACIIAYASAVASLAETALLSGHVPKYPTRCVITGAEKLHPHERHVIEAAFRKPVHERYGSRDVGLMGFQLEPGRSHEFTVDWMNLLVEPENSEEPSSIVVTKLHADGMPMIRYRVGDEARFSTDSKPGHPTFVLKEVVGRDTDYLWNHDGSSISGISFPHMFKDFPIAEFQVLQRADYDVTLKVVPKSALSVEAQNEILRIVRSNLPGLAVRIEIVEGIAKTRSNKRRPVISEVHQYRGEGK